MKKKRAKKMCALCFDFKKPNALLLVKLPGSNESYWECKKEHSEEESKDYELFRLKRVLNFML